MQETEQRTRGSVDLGKGVVSRAKRFEAKEDARGWFERGYKGTISLYAIGIPGAEAGRDREYIAVPNVKEMADAEERFPGSSQETDFYARADQI